MKEKALFITNICLVLLFGIYLVTALFVDYPKSVNIIVLSVYFLYAVVRVIYFMKRFRKWPKITKIPNHNPSIHTQPRDKQCPRGIFVSVLCHPERSATPRGARSRTFACRGCTLGAQQQAKARIFAKCECDTGDCPLCRVRRTWYCGAVPRVVATRDLWTVCATSV